MILIHLGHQEASSNQLWMALSQTSKKYNLKDLSQNEKQEHWLPLLLEMALSTADSPQFHKLMEASNSRY